MSDKIRFLRPASFFIFIFKKFWNHFGYINNSARDYLFNGVILKLSHSLENGKQKKKKVYIYR